MDDEQDPARLTHTIDTMFSSCRGVSFELKTRPDGPGVMHPAGSFSHGSSARIFPHAFFVRSEIQASGHFCDVEVGDVGSGTDDDECYGVADEETMVVASAAGAVGDLPASNRPRASSAPHGRSRLGVMLLDQGLFTVYKRLFALCVALNAAGLALAVAGRFPYARGHAAVFAMGNILALTLCRSEAVLRVVFWLAVNLLGKTWVPVVVKTGATAILQSLGGAHSGCGVSSLAWLVYALAQALQKRDDLTPREIVGVASAIPGLLALSCLAAFPLVRHLHHNVFERTHRFAGWAALALLWAFVVLSAAYAPATKSYARLTVAAVAKRQELWLASAITFFTFLPWLTVRRVPVTVTARSAHASLITFRGGVRAGLLGRISRSPLSEWHAFGIISDGGDTHAMLAGAVGDFTRGLIADPPARLWVRGVHFAGLPYLINMYRSAAMVATGSGICVFLSLLMQPSATEMSLVWVAKGIDANYGEEIKAAVSGSERLRGRVVVHDTAVMGRPDVAAMVVDAARRWGAEVVVVTSNPEGSRDVVRGCRKAGIPAFGPIWDS
ncbi:hypothetical protein EJB05_17872, partial [Eragrostis curvula]